MKKKGFTLVELMGVITVIGLISLLIVPTIINQIRNNKEKLDSVTQQLIYSATELFLDNKKTEYPKYNGAIYCLTLKDLVEDGKLSEPVIDYNGNEISLDKIVAVNVRNSNYYYELPSSCEDVTIYSNRFMYSGSDCIEDSTTICPNGTLVSVQVNDLKTYNFYVINDTGEKITLILDRNLGERVEWISKKDYFSNPGASNQSWNNKTNINIFGPLSVLKALHERTNSWTNLPKIRINTFDYEDGREGVLGNDNKFLTYARLPKYSELSVLLDEKELLPSYLTDNLNSSSGHNSFYWLSTANSLNKDADDNSGAFVVSYEKKLSSLRVDMNYFSSIRPVIELFK